MRFAAQAVATAACLAAASVIAATHGDADSTGAGHLARLLSRHDDARVAAAVSPGARAQLDASRLATGWAEAVASVGNLERVERTLSVDEDGGDVDEIEVLQFRHGEGTLVAHRANSGIDALVLLVSTAKDPSLGATASSYAAGAAGGDIDALSSAFEPRMTAQLPPTVLRADLAALFEGLRGHARVVASVLQRSGTFVIAQEYVAFDNGIRRVQIAFDAQRRVAGLYIRRF